MKHNQLELNKALEAAVYNGNSSTVKLLIELGANINIKTSDSKETLLVLALKRGFDDIALILINNNIIIYPSMLEDNTISPLVLAAKNGSNHIIKEIINRQK